MGPHRGVAALALVALTLLGTGCLRPVADNAGIGFGYAVEPSDLLTDPLYADVVVADANTLTFENAMKWDFIHPSPDTYDFRPVDTVLDFAVAHDMQVRGHPLIWHSQVPSWLDAGLHDASLGTGEDDGTWAAMWTRETLLAVMEDHITTVIGHFETNYPGVVTQYDVVNEPFWTDGSLRPTVWQQVIGDDYIEHALRFARAAAPGAELYVNDFLSDSIVTGEYLLGRGPYGFGADQDITTCPEIPKCTAIETWATDLVGRGVPLDGIGLEGHHLTGLANGPPDFDVLMEWTVPLGLSWALTELDVVLPYGVGDDPVWLQNQAGWYESMVGDCVDAPNCDTIVVWGASDGHSWLAPPWFGHAGLRGEDYSAKPALTAVWLRLYRAGA